GGGDAAGAPGGSTRRGARGPPRQLDAAVPSELDRICLRALAQRASDRYSTAHDLAEDLRHWLAAGQRSPAPQLQVSPPAVHVQVVAPAHADAAAASVSTPVSRADPGRRPGNGVPPGPPAP